MKTIDITERIYAARYSDDYDTTDNDIITELMYAIDCLDDDMRSILETITAAL